ncbi:hypothetical protein [Ottowia sp.]|uniref:hypothetical protein n=1 Tax=Ottowia sp. TaxID=1898956 RepID=UPI002602168E|nr:hypothetical protein [Ottowia sp.]
MHIVMVMFGGILQLAFFVIFGWHWGNSSAAMALAAKLFIPVWLMVVAVNMWVGVAHAGYSAKEEFPILIANFLVPALVAGFAAWQLSRG